MIERPTNPFHPPDTVANETGVFAESATLVSRGFLYRVIDFDEPVPFRFEYNGWWWVQRVLINGRRVWMRISWLTIDRHVDCVLPLERDHHCAVDIRFGNGLMIRRFQVAIDGIVRYDEIH